MTTKPSFSTRLAVLAFAVQFAVVPAAFGQGVPSGPPEADQAAAEEAKGFSADQLEQIVAPVALYPDALLMQVFMAATYPLEIVEADRWVRKNSGLKGDTLDAAAAKQEWDASVQSLTHFSGVLERMSENLDWTKDLGDAFLGQQADMLNAVQVMRQKAYAAGNLQTNSEQNITVEAVSEPSTTTIVVKQPTQIIRIEPAQPEVIYVPTYSSTVVYGAPPATVYYPTVYSPAYVATASVISFGAGMAIGAAIWGDCDWHHYGVYGYPGYYGGGYHGSYYGGGYYKGGNYNGGHYNGGHNNVTINGDVNINGRPGNGGNWNGNNRPGGDGRPEQWGHQPEHRKGVGYSNNKVASTYGQKAQTRPSGGDGARGYDRGSYGSSSGTKDRGSYGGSSSGTKDRGSYGGSSSGTKDKGSYGGSSSGTKDKGSYGGGNSGTKDKGSYGGSSSGTKDKGSSSSGSGAFSGRGASSDRAASSRGASSRDGGGGGGGRR